MNNKAMPMMKLMGKKMEIKLFIFSFNFLCYLRTLESFLRKYVKLENQTVKEFLAEVLGTFILAIFALSTIAQYKFFRRDNPNEGTVLSINIGTGFGVAIGIIVVGKVSGAHFNPAVSFAMLLTRRMGFLRFFVYCLGQFVGAFLGALMVFLVYYDVLKSYGNNMHSLETAAIFATYPNKNVSILGCFLDQSFVTALLGTKNCSIEFALK
jgi:glycerol uptake facilitator protein